MIRMDHWTPRLDRPVANYLLVIHEATLSQRGHVMVDDRLECRGETGGSWTPVPLHHRMSGMMSCSASSPWQPSSPYGLRTRSSRAWAAHAVTHPVPPPPTRVQPRLASKSPSGPLGGLVPRLRTAVL